MKEQLKIGCKIFWRNTGEWQNASVHKSGDRRLWCIFCQLCVSIVAYRIPVRLINIGRPKLGRKLLRWVKRVEFMTGVWTFEFPVQFPSRLWLLVRAACTPEVYHVSHRKSQRKLFAIACAYGRFSISPFFSRATWLFEKFGLTVAKSRELWNYVATRRLTLQCATRPVIRLEPRFDKPQKAICLGWYEQKKSLPLCMVSYNSRAMIRQNRNGVNSISRSCGYVSPLQERVSVWYSALYLYAPGKHNQSNSKWSAEINRRKKERNRTTAFFCLCNWWSVWFGSSYRCALLRFLIVCFSFWLKYIVHAGTGWVIYLFLFFVAIVLHFSSNSDFLSTLVKKRIANVKNRTKSCSNFSSHEYATVLKKLRKKYLYIQILPRSQHGSISRWY